jgi:hypothetical protein
VAKKAKRSRYTASKRAVQPPNSMPPAEIKPTVMTSPPLKTAAPAVSAKAEVAYPYASREVRRILLMTGVILVVLVAVSLLMR